MNLQYKTKSKPLKSAQNLFIGRKTICNSACAAVMRHRDGFTTPVAARFTKKSVLRDVEHRWMYAHGESNPNRWNRNPVFYPLNYGRKAIVCECKVNEN